MIPQKTKQPYLFSAPLCGYTRYPFRKILSSFSFDLIFTEMVSVDAIYYNNKETESIYATFDETVPVGVQVFGSKIDHFLVAIEKLASLNRFAVFDVNCGCPVPKVVKTGGGSGLLNDPNHLYNIFNALVKNFPHLDFTAKIRLGLNAHHLPYKEVADSLCKGGAKLITVHGRTANQYYSGDVNYTAIKEIKQSVNIPVIGNGNIFSPQDAKTMLDLTGCDGVMLARGIIKNPFLVNQIRNYLEIGNYNDVPLSEKLELMEHHLQLENSFDPTNGYKEYKKIALAYLKGIAHAKEYKVKIATANSSNQMMEVLQEMKEELLGKEKINV